MKLVPIDFEYSDKKNQNLDLICTAFTVDGVLYQYWLVDDFEEQRKCKEHIIRLRDQGYIFVCWNGVAEGHSFISLNVSPVKCTWIDVHAEWKMLTNHCNAFSYGKQLVDGKVVTIDPPKYGDVKFKAKVNLAAGVFKLLGIKIDTDHKDQMRDVCIRADREELINYKDDIINYCASDIKYLVEMWEVIKAQYKKRLTKRTFTKLSPSGKEVIDTRTIDYTVKRSEVFRRGDAMARTAMMTALGYPVDVDMVKNFQDNVPSILKELAEDINNNLDTPIFRWNKAQNRYSVYQQPIKDWIEASEYKDKWLLTDTDGYSLAMPAFEKFFSFRHDFPKTLPAQYMRYLKTKKSLNGFLPVSPTAKDKSQFTDAIGEDGRVRSWLNPFGAQSSRFQPASKFFIPLKSAWMRTMIQPKPGRAICSIDYKSEEFLLGGLISGDRNMLEAYKSGDVYLYFAKLAGAVPMDGTKEQYSKERNLFKSTTLGISYLMGAGALARKLTADTGDKYTQEQAQELIRKFSKAYPKYTAWQDQAFNTYKSMEAIKLPCGWVMFGDNQNARSVKNVPVQGMGGSVLRKAIELAQDAGLDVLYPLHDALYIEYNSDDVSAIDTLKDCMQEAFSFYFNDEFKRQANELIQFDIDAWSYDYRDCYLETPEGNEVKLQTRYVDPRSVGEYDKFKKYM